MTVVSIQNGGIQNTGIAYILKRTLFDVLTLKEIAAQSRYGGTGNALALHVHISITVIAGVAMQSIFNID